MCLSTVYKKNSDENILLCRNVARVLQNDGEIVLFDLFGKKTVIHGSIVDIDLMENNILVKES